MQKIVPLSVIFWCLLCGAVRLSADDLQELSRVEASEPARAETARKLLADTDTRLLDVLSAMQGQSASINNWYLAIAQSIADRDPQAARAELLQFLSRTSENPSARYWAFTFITRDRPQEREQMLANMLADPCLELRFEAVELGLKQLAESENTATVETRRGRTKELLAAARLPEQVQQVAKQLDELGEKVDLLQHFGFLSKWQVIGPFPNLQQASFDEVYGPEKDYVAGETSLVKKYVGKAGEVAWQATETEAADGGVDLNVIFKNEKGAVVYAVTQFESSGEVDCEVRIGCPNACKVWVNGKLCISREVYHTGTQIDQYVAPVSIRPGANSVLIKVCQNEQTDPWAQDWICQLRFTDESGSAIRFKQ